jgi:prepilin-type N-terminal cleavage/methylation domain-containing protein
MARRRIHGFTLVEMLVAAAIFSMVTVGLLTFGATSSRLIARNLATNHSHETMRISDLALLRGLHDAASPFRLVDFDGTAYSDADPAPSPDRDALTQQFASTRSNGVRFRQLAGGPYRFTSDTKASDTSLRFDFRDASGGLSYIPQVGDKVVMPLLAREFDISAVTKTPTGGSTTGIVTISDPAGIGFTIDTTTTGNMTTAYFYRSVAYTVHGGKLRYHPNYTGANRATFTVVRDKITSPKPFALLFAPDATVSDGLNLRISLEFYDSTYSARRFTGGTVTLQATVPPRTRPTPVSSTNAS